MIKGCNSETGRGKRCTGQIWGKSVELPCLLPVYHSPGTSVCSPAQKIFESSPIVVFMEASSHGHGWLNYQPLAIDLNFQRISPPGCYCCCLVPKSEGLRWQSIQLFATPWTVACQTPLSISQARMLWWVAISFSRRSSRTRDWTIISCTGRWILNHRRTEIPNALNWSFQPSNHKVASQMTQW